MNAPGPILSDLGQAALDYAARGWHVFPCAPGGKAPLISKKNGGNGHLDATTDQAKIVEWWTRTPGANIGFHPARSGIVVVDPDLYKPECEWHNFILGRDVPETLLQRSPRGGLHYFFVADPDEDFAEELCGGVDIKHDGYILLEPSRFEGGQYTFETDDDPAPAPEWIPRKGARATKSTKGPIGDATDAERETIIAGLANCRNDLPRDEWVRLALALKHALGDTGEPAWLEFSARYDGEQKPGEAARVWRTARPDGGVSIGTVLHMLAQLPKIKEPTPAPSAKPRLRTARDLQGMSFPPIKWIVPGFLPEGLTILAGAPKVGKSWLTLDLARAVASGGETLGQKVEGGSVLLLALEDNERRLQDRLDRITGDEDWPDRLAYSTEWPRFDAGGIAAIVEWLDATPDARLIIVDTLAHVKPLPKGKNGSAYDHDVAALRPLHQLASQRRVSVVVITHLRKMEADDPVERISSTMGLTGVADTVSSLLRGPGGLGHILWARGRDLAEFERAVKLVDCRWQIEGDPLEAFANDSRRAIFKALREGATTTKQIEAACEASDIAGATVRKTLRRMVKAGDITQLKRGEYSLNPLSHPSQCHNGTGESDACDHCDTMSVKETA